MKLLLMYSAMTIVFMPVYLYVCVRAISTAWHKSKFEQQIKIFERSTNE